MKKKFLLFGALVGALLLSSCSGEVKADCILGKYGGIG